MQFKFKIFKKEILYAWQKRREPCVVNGEYDKIVGVTGVVFGFQFMLRKLVKLVHVYVHEKLACEIPERETFACRARIETADDVSDPGEGAALVFLFLQDFPLNL